MRKTKLTVVILLAMLLSGLPVLAATMETDVVIVGAGGGGLSAAIEAADAGASVVLLEKMPFPGGSTIVSGGIIHAAGTQVQELAGYSDDAEAMFHYRMVLSNGRIDSNLVQIASDQSADAIHWLMDLGVDFPSELLYVSGYEPIPRGHRTSNGGVGIIQPLVAAVEARANIEFLLQTPAVDLLVENDDVVGVIALTKDGETLTIRANAVVLATGGFGADEEMMRMYLPELAAQGSRYNWFGSQGATGDGIRMAQKLDGQIVGMEAAGALVGTTVSEVPVSGWMVYVNQNGQRFTNEAGFYGFVMAQFERQPNNLAWAIFDAAGAERAGLTQEVLAANILAGKVFTGETAEELALNLGISNPTALANTIEQYNGYVASGKDSTFLKDASALQAVDTAPFYAVQILNNRALLTPGGLRINEYAQVLTNDGSIIPGLFAAGETTGGLIGDIYPGSGTAINDAIVFGRIAGKEAAKLSQ